MKNIIKTTAIVALMVLSATVAFAQNNEVDPGTGTNMGGTKLKIVATFPTPTNLDRIITNAGAKVTWHDPNGSVPNLPVNGVKTGAQEFTFGDWSPIGGTQPVWVTYEVWGFNDNHKFGYGTDGTYYLQSNNDVLYITTWKYTYQVEGEGNDDI